MSKLIFRVASGRSAPRYCYPKEPLEVAPQGQVDLRVTPYQEDLMNNEPFKRLMCLGCGFSYDEALGLPEHGLAPGTRWADIPEDWVCPDCGTPKNMFEMIVIGYAAGGPDLAQAA
jgi:rubredoxin